ncbi:tRNA (adenosine(37)-N6)-threonylcarbamoyltransferase complex dimerization subunit type 1 TsaB [Flavobacteriaceae bacterium]|jgi:tRNA threonylcarbamoyladenosine biosynthesis protein TsaB|nr:tRNA (adenosine(37)-N6)-threonylcarbamoyltransferase complex dimerization subunit type 1 TsaB [Flavobacteriaceae bacterium]
MNYILHIDTTTKKCSVALAQDGELMIQKELLSEEFSHSEQLHPFIEEVLKESGLKSSSLSAIAISKGPGSYTGLRIGVAAAKGLCFALDLPLIALNTLEIMVQPYEVSPYSFIIPMLDARRMEVYTAIFDETKKWIQETMAEVLTENTFTSIVNEQSCLIIGDGAIKFKTLHPKINASYTNEIHYPVAKDMITLAWKKFNAKEFEDLAYFEPFYLKDFQTTPPKK